MCVSRSVEYVSAFKVFISHILPSDMSTPRDNVRDAHMVRSKWSHGPKIWSHGPDGNNSVGYVQVRKRMVNM